jgi:hypothetical protein
MLVCSKMSRLLLDTDHQDHHLELKDNRWGQDQKVLQLVVIHKDIRRRNCHQGVEALEVVWANMAHHQREIRGLNIICCVGILMELVVEWAMVMNRIVLTRQHLRQDKNFQLV